MTDWFQVRLTEFDIAGIIYYLINIPILIFAMTKIGRKFLIKTVFSITAMTVFMAIIPTMSIVENMVTACVVGGIITGGTVGITLRMGASLGGIDVIGLLVANKRNNSSIGKLNLIVNPFLYGVCLFLFTIEIVFYSLIFATAYSVAIDKVHIQNINVEVKIVTKADTDMIEKGILEEMKRGITKWNAWGTYTGGEAYVLYVVLSKYEVGQLKAIIHEYDLHAFIVINEGVSVDGNYLKKL